MPIVTELSSGFADPTPYDYIVVGAGSAGCVVARRLVENTDGRVLLIEAGEFGHDLERLYEPTRWLENMGSSHDWKYLYEPTRDVADRAIPLPRGKVVGGSGQINGLVWYRGHRADYDAWAEAGNIGWDYQSILPHFRASETWEDGSNDYRGGSGPIRVERARDLHFVAEGLIEAAQSRGLPYLDDINVPSPEGAGPLNMNVHRGRRSSPWSAYLEPIVEIPRLTLLTNAQVRRLVFDRNRCIGVKIASQSLASTVRATTDVILCAGAIDTARLLLLSGVGNADELRANDIPVVHDLPGVGKNLQDHVILGGLCFAASRPTFPFNNNLEGACVICRSDPAVKIPDLMFFAMQIPFATPEISQEFPIPENAFCMVPALMNIESRGELKLNGPNLRIQPNMLSEEADLQALVAAIDIGLDLADQAGLKQRIASWAAPTARLSRSRKVEFARRAASSYAHPVGTSAMGNGKEHVVDFDLRVRGLTGLRVADASVMPTIPRANTHAATVAIAEVAASKIASAHVR